MPSRIVKTDAEWRARLTPLQYNVTRRRGTERAFSGEYREQQLPGTYACVCCGSRLFGSDAKLQDGSGWPSFRAPLRPDAVRLDEDNAWLHESTEAVCARCDAHLGHMLDQAGEQRFCINSAALRFEPGTG